MALAHAISDTTEKAYRRGDLFDRRRRLMTAWEEFALATRREVQDKLVPLHHTGLWKRRLFLNGNFLENFGDSASLCARTGTFFSTSDAIQKKSPGGNFFNWNLTPAAQYSRSGTLDEHMMNESAVDRTASQLASEFGAVIRNRRKALKMRQDQLALATGVGRRFLIDLESGKPSCQLGRSLLVAGALGLKASDILRSGQGPSPTAAAELPDLPDEMGGSNE
jgi:DNA-binding XRE family transcriptional regulator